MPEVIVKYPAGLFASQDQAQFEFVKTLKSLVAKQMSAIDHRGKKITFDPNKEIDLVALPYDPIMSQTTAYGHWTDRNDTITERLDAICKGIKDCVPTGSAREGQDTVSATFIGKNPGCWAFA
jgi:hypothetical protein